MFTEAGGNLLADLAGYFLGAAAPAPFGAPVNSPVPTCTTPAVGFATVPGRPDHLRVVAARPSPTCRTG